MRRSLPIFIDGTCNGLQHFAALSRDPDLARLVNLEPSDSPQDIYQEVAAAALQDIQHRAKRGSATDRRAALLWLRIIGTEAPRSLAKKVVMVKPYGGTIKVALEAARDFLDAKDPQRLERGSSVSENEIRKARRMAG